MATPVKTQTGGAKTIPELRDAFDRIEGFARDLMNGGGPTKENARKLASEWKEVFGRKLDTKAAEEYLGFITGGASTAAPEPPKRNKTRKAKRSMAGGAAPVAGAPLDYQTRPGIDGPYGNFAPYVDGGFGVGVPAISQNYIMTPKLEPTIDAGEGGNRPLQTGGGKKKTAKRKLRANQRKTLRGGSKFILSAAPTTALQDAVTAWRGQALPVSGDPTSTAFKL